MAKKVLKRSEQRVEDTWDLTAIYKTDADYEAAVEILKNEADEFAKFQGHVTESADTLLKVLTTYQDYSNRINRAFQYAQRLSDQDTGNTENLARLGKLTSISTGIRSKTAFLEPELLTMSKETLDSYYKEQPALEEFRVYLTEKFRVKEHMLSAEMEQVLAMAGEVRSASSNTYGLFNNADLVFPEIVDENGEKARITHGTFIPFLECADRRVRKDAFEGLYSTYKQYRNAIASMYNGQVKSLMFNAKVRKYNSTLEAAVDGNNVSPAIYKNLVESVNANMDKMYRYVRLRKKLLGVDELHMYDVYTPIIKDVAVDIPFEEAKQTVLKALAPLGERYISILKGGFESRWIDVYENEGKRSGAYSSGCKGTHPYVLLNYNNTLDNEFTLAHEMGHSMHSYFSCEANNYFNAGYKIFVAEVASTVNEVLLVEYLLKNTTDKAQRAYLLNHFADSFKGTVYRQTMFAEFEMLTNEMAERGESLNADSLSKTYHELNKKYFGPDMVSDDLIAMEWARIPHFYYNFYVYQYATSFCASVAIARRILKEGQPAVDSYLKFLSSGCTQDPVSLLKIAGVDMSTKAPIDAALQVFDEIIAEMEKITE